MIPNVLLRIESSAGFGRDLLRGIANYSHIHGSWVFRRHFGHLERLMPPMGDWRPDGIIARFSDTKSAEKAIPRGVPTIAIPIKEQIEDMPNVLVDDTAVGALAADYLLRLGLEHFSFCGYKTFWSRDRCSGFVERIGQAGFEPVIYNSSWSASANTWPKERKALTDWLQKLPKPLGLMACNDFRACDVIEACRITGLRVPEDVAVIGVDDDELYCELSKPPITSVHIAPKSAGYQAAQLLAKMMDGYRCQNEHIWVQPTRVAHRQSTDVLATNNRMVAEAVRFIRQNAKNSITVQDVLDVLPVPQRTLYDQFQRTLGRSIIAEIRRARTEEIRKRLLETDMSISEIATELHFPSAKHIARYFAQEMGMTPLAFRKKLGNR